MPNGIVHPPRQTSGCPQWRWLALQIERTHRFTALHLRCCSIQHISNSDNRLINWWSITLIENLVASVLAEVFHPIAVEVLWAQALEVQIVRPCVCARSRDVKFRDAASKRAQCCQYCPDVPEHQGTLECLHSAFSVRTPCTCMNAYRRSAFVQPFASVMSPNVSL
jgi:hypothetical protein